MGQEQLTWCLGPTISQGKACRGQLGNEVDWQGNLAAAAEPAACEFPLWTLLAVLAPQCSYTEVARPLVKTETVAASRLFRKAGGSWMLRCIIQISEKIPPRVIWNL